MTDRALDDWIDEVALGLATEAETAELEARAAREPEVAARLAQARARFAALDDTADEEPMPAGFWEGIASRIDSDAAPGQTRAAPEAQVIDMAPMLRAMRRWRVAAAGGFAAALLLAAMLGTLLLSPAQPTVIAVLLDDAGQPVAVVEGRADNTTLITLLEAAQVPDDQVMQVWTKPDDDGPPVSLGLLPTRQSRTLSVDGLPPPHPDQLYEITFEPAGGSPTNLPTGPIHGKGLAQAPVY